MTPKTQNSEHFGEAALGDLAQGRGRVWFQVVKGSALALGAAASDLRLRAGRAPLSFGLHVEEVVVGPGSRPAPGHDHSPLSNGA